MKTAVVCLAISIASSSAYAASCVTEAANKKLAGAAKNSFLTKCENDAEAACASKATNKKLAGAAKASFTSKCVKDAVGG